MHTSAAREQTGLYWLVMDLPQLCSVLDHVVVVVSLLFNAFFVYCVACSKRLKKVPHFLALQLAVINFVYTATVLPIGALSEHVPIIRESMASGGVLCTVTGALSDMSFTGHLLMLMALSYDRVLPSFCHPATIVMGAK